MIKDDFKSKRKLNNVDIETDLVIIGGGLAGVCSAITAARSGLNVVIVQDRPVLGGNSSSEVRLWILGATSHMGNNNRWAREGGVVDELLVENMYRNKEGNPLIFDAILLDKVVNEKNITLLLNTAVYDIDKSSPEVISAVKAFCSQNSTTYHIKAPYFCDASGDGIVGFLAGAAFRMGAEKEEEFGEKFAPSKEYGELLGHSLYFYSKDVGKPVSYTAPEFALRDITEIPRFRSFNTKDYGCRLWWLEYGGRLDTVHATEQIKWELWKVVYGVWDYIKNSGQFPEAENLTLEWVGTIPGKRESRRFEGDYMIKQQDIIEQRKHYDAVAFGGWSIDLHPADGVFSEKPGCNQWHSKGIYQIPYRCLYSKNIKNLFLTGRIISATHVAFASTRVMATAAHVGQAVGMAAKIVTQLGISPRDLAQKSQIHHLQQALLETGQHIPGFEFADSENLIHQSVIDVSSQFKLNSLSKDLSKKMEFSVAQMLPISKGKVPSIKINVEADKETKLIAQLRTSSVSGNYTPDVILEEIQIGVIKGPQSLSIDFSVDFPEDTYAFIVFIKNENLQIYYSEKRITGILSVFNLVNKAVSNYGKQTPPSDIGVEEFEFWCPQRRPDGQNVAMVIEPAISKFSADNLLKGVFRPTNEPNAWVAALEDKNPTLSLIWPNHQKISRIELFFDTDFDHPMESVLMGHPESVMPFCVREFSVFDELGNVVFSTTKNYQTRVIINLSVPIHTKLLKINLAHPSSQTPAALFGVRCFS